MVRTAGGRPSLHTEWTMDRLERIHATLADVLQRRPQAFEAPVTVAEIYQDLVPYRAVRAELGFDMNADYEHTLLRLLAGEGELARLEPEEARQELREELDSPNPNVGLFRKFAGCDVFIVRPAAMAAVRTEEAGRIVDLPQDDVPATPDTWEARAAIWLDPAAEDDAGDGTAPQASAEDIVEPPEIELLLEEEVEAPAVGQAPVAAPKSNPPHAEEMRVTMASPTSRENVGTDAGVVACAFCDSTLPHGRTIRFCPYCGADQALVPCGSCGEALHPDWRFCVACGTGVEA
jgi:hypothetical protein